MHDTALRSVCAVLAITGVSAALTVSGTDRTTWLLSFLVFVKSGAGMLYVHIDLDVIDVVELKANSYSTPGGLAVSQVADIIRTAASRVSFSAASITALDPTLGVLACLERR